MMMNIESARKKHQTADIMNDRGMRKEHTNYKGKVICVLNIYIRLGIYFGARVLGPVITIYIGFRLLLTSWFE